LNRSCRDKDRVPQKGRQEANLLCNFMLTHSFDEEQRRVPEEVKNAYTEAGYESAVPHLQPWYGESSPTKLLA